MRAHDSNLLILFGLLALAVAPVSATAASDDPAEADEFETDDLPAWTEGDVESPVQVQSLRDYGADIPDPADVAAGRRPRTIDDARPAASAPAPSAPASAVRFEDFHSELAPHGRWVDTSEYGTVFVPARQTEVTGWRPYLYGQWAWTSYGWTWVSEEPFGWATYHYGRWTWRPVLGWVWVPGYVWGPAWVAWRYGDDGVVGWAPLYPGYVTWTASYPYHASHWIFVGPRHFYGHPIHRHWHRDRSDYWYGRSRWSRNWRSGGSVYVGPSRRHVERTSRGRVFESRVIAVGSSRRGEAITARGAGSAGAVRIYRPTNRAAVVRREGNTGRNTHPGPGRSAPGAVGRRDGAGQRPSGAPGNRRPEGPGQAPLRSPAERSSTPRAAPSTQRPSAPGERPSAPRAAPSTQRPSAPAGAPGVSQPGQTRAPSGSAPARSSLRPSEGPAGGLRPVPRPQPQQLRMEDRSAPAGGGAFSPPSGSRSESVAPRPAASASRSSTGARRPEASTSGSSSVAPRPAASSSRSSSVGPGPAASSSRSSSVAPRPAAPSARSAGPRSAPPARSAGGDRGRPTHR